MDFVVDKSQNKVTVTRAFLAPLEKVWAAWTESEWLDQWWAPKPWKADTATMDFKEGGFWLYAMGGPDGEKHWSRADYEKIEPLKSFSGVDAFCDEHGNLIEDFPKSYWNVKFIQTKDATTVVIEIKYDSLADLEKYIEMGFKEGFTSALGNLDELLI